MKEFAALIIFVALVCVVAWSAKNHSFLSPEARCAVALERIADALEKKK